MNSYDYADLDELTGLNRYLVQLRKQRTDNYLKDPKDLKSRVNSETQTRDDYSGREILELLQNAVDASHDGDKVVVELDDDILRVCNNGDSFTEGGVDSLLIPNLSPKNEFENLGNKGLGFRSLLNGSEYVIVYSGDLSIRMSLNDAQEYKKQTGLAVRPPILSVPRVIKPLEQKNFVTIVECKIKDVEFIAQIKNQIDAIDSRSMIFLPKISAIELRVDGQTRLISKTQDGKVCRVEVMEGDEITATEYYIATKEIKNVDTGNIDEDGQKVFRDIHITIARDLNDERKFENRYDRIYNAFPTRVTMPTGWIVNANLGLNADRNSINEKEYNWLAMVGAVDLMFEEAEKLAKERFGFDALRTLMGNYEKFDFEFAGRSIEGYFIDRLKQAKLLPGVNGNYLSLAEKPYFYYENLTQYLSGEGFEKTVMYCDSREIDELLQKYISGNNTYHRMPQDEIVKLINVRLNKMDIETQIALSILFAKEYINNTMELPDFFVDQNGERIFYKTEKYTESGSSVAKNVPSFLSIKFVKKEYIDEIRRQTETSSQDFESSNYAKYYNIKQYRLLNIAKSYKVAVEDNARRAQEYLRWLYENEISVEKISEEGLGDVRIPAKCDGAVNVHDGILPGGIYEELFPDSGYIIEEFGDGSERWKLFLMGLGIQEFPSYFGKDFTSGVFGDILQNNKMEQIRRLLNTQVWLGQDSTAKNLINDTAWIEYEGGKYSPHQIIFDDEYGKKFSNVLGVNGVEMRSYLSFEHHIFDVLEFRDSIAEMPIVDIYSILAELPDKDRRGKLAKKIYRLLTNPKEFLVDDKVLQCKNRNGFVENGSVFCKDGKYHPVKETVYFAQGLLPSAAIKNRNLIDVDKKRGAEKIKKLFGVERLIVDCYIDQFEPHIFQQQFVDVLISMKIGILATDKIELAEETKSDVKTLKIQLCRTASVMINGENKVLEDYEFAAKNSASEYCIKIPGFGMSFEDVRYQPRFINALTEMFVMRIGTVHAEDNSDSIARMIEARNVKDVIDLQENGVERYKEAAEFMGEAVELEKDDEEDEIYERNSQALELALTKYEELYMKNLYDRLLNEPVEEQARFESLRNDYVNFDGDDEALLKKDFDADKYVFEYFGMREDVDNDVGEDNWQKVQAEFGDELNYHDDWKSLARFGRFDEVRKRAEEYGRRIQELKSKVEDEAEEIPEAEVITRERVAVKKKRGSGGGIRRGGFGGGGGNSDYAHDIGKLGQEIVKKHLREHGYLEVTDCSGEAIRAGTNVNASDSYGYDITCVDADGIKHYIEVKSHGDRVPQISFEMSRNEYINAGKLSGEKNCVYEIYLVDQVDKSRYDVPRIEALNFAEIKGKMSPEDPKKYYYCGGV